MVFRPAPEEEALSRWAEGYFLDVERQFAKRWRNQLKAIDLSDMSKKVLASIGGNWRKPKSLEDAKRMADLIIDYMDSEC
jgi:hypothetical protein